VRIYPGNVGRRGLGYELRKKASNSFLSIFKGLNYARVKCEDPKIIRRQLVFSYLKIILSCSIDPDNSYNFDETGFVIGLTVSAKVITRREYYSRRLLL
jgi:hypothetical protein